MVAEVLPSPSEDTSTTFARICVQFDVGGDSGGSGDTFRLPLDSGDSSATSILG